MRALGPRLLRAARVLLAGMFALRGALAWGVDVAGRRAAMTVLALLRLWLAAKSLFRY